MIPPEQTRIRLEAGVPVFATWKSHPTKDSEFLEWYKRIEAARTIYDGGPGAQEALKALLESHAVTHVIWPESKGAFPFPQTGQAGFRRQLFQPVGYALSRLLKNAHLLRCAHHASLRRTKSTPHFA